ncbi:hypothetical protein CR513_41519, partial [Mucuna pruriens]
MPQGDGDASDTIKVARDLRMHHCFVTKVPGILLSRNLAAAMLLLKTLLPAELLFCAAQHDDSDSPQTPRSCLGFNSRNLNASLEDSATNLAK